MTPQVFVNFRGEDMRKCFVSHLLSSFKMKYITSFIASEPFEALDHEALETSLVAIPVISKRYTESDWWVKELSRIIECEKIGTLTVVPIFFQVNPLDILSHALAKYANVKIQTLEIVKRWLYAQVSRKSSFHSHDWEDDSELVEKVTGFVSDILRSSTSSYPSIDLSPAPSLKVDNEFRFPSLGYRFRSSLIEYTEIWQPDLPNLERHREKLRAIISRSESRIIGILGMEGVGKTTLAKALYEDISPRFQHHIYRNNKVMDMYNQPFNLREMFRSDTFTESSFHGSTEHFIKEMIGHRKVLLVIDDVDDITQLKAIIKDASWFGPGSRVIVTTQSRFLLTQCGVQDIYEVECPRYEEALAFFSEFAFKQSSPLPGFEGLSFRALHVANRLPLGLKVLGSFLHDKEKDEWVTILGRLEESRDNYASQVNSYIGADDYAPRRPIKVDGHIGVDEANCFPLYCLALE